jgi:uncharacterized protein YjiS (DUF1127 family)
MRATATVHPFDHIFSFAQSVYGSFAEAVLRLALKPVHFYRARSVMTRLSSMSDHELSDIGLTQADLSSAMVFQDDVDPTAALAEIAAERRRWRRAG